jgi:glycosyl-4,4'-diaponeurosporenoate acyltransferase
VIPLVELPDPVMVGLDIVVWGGWSALVGFWAHRRPERAFDHDTAITRLRSFENARFYERGLHIKRWKDRLPEAGALFTGGFAKRTVQRASLARFVTETRRAEWTHWTIMLATPVFLVWSWWWVELVMVAYALAANAPCLLVQRYNRMRLLRALAS